MEEKNELIKYMNCCKIFGHRRKCQSKESIQKNNKSGGNLRK